jgi:hypothetical protein
VLGIARNKLRESRRRGRVEDRARRRLGFEPRCSTTPTSPAWMSSPPPTSPLRGARAPGHLEPSDRQPAAHSGSEYGEPGVEFGFTAIGDAEFRTLTRRIAERGDLVSSALAIMLRYGPLSLNLTATG